MQADRPKRIQRQRTKGWRMPEGAVYVGRPTIWGNPFVHPDQIRAVEAFRSLISAGTKSFSISKDGLQFARNAHPNTLHWAYGEFIRDNAPKLRGCDLACWCPLGQPCHADVLL